MREFIADAAIYLVGRAVPALIGFLTVAIFVRRMGEQDYGFYSIVFSGVNLISMVAVGWLSQAILRFQARPEGHGVRFDRTVALGVSCACATALLGTAVLLFAKSQNLANAEAIAASCVLVTGLTVHTVYTASLQAALRARAVVAMEILRAIIALPAGVLGMSVINPPYVGAVLGTGTAYVLSAALARILAVKSLRGLERNQETFTVLETVRQLFWFGWPISLWYGVSFSFPFAERSLIQLYLGPAAAGQYAAVYDVIYRGCGFVLLPIVLAVHPRIMKAHSLGRVHESRRLWGSGLALQFIISCAVTAAAAATAPWIIRLTGLRSTDTAVTLVYPLAAAGCVWQMALIAHKQLEAGRQTRLMLGFLIVALLLDIVINVTTLPRFGPVAAAYALLLTGALYVVCVVLAGLARVRASELPERRWAVTRVAD